MQVVNNFSVFFIRFFSRLCCCEHAISHTKTFSYSLFLSIKSGLLAVVVFLRLKSKSYTSFILSFSNIVPLSHCSLVLLSYCSLSVPLFFVFVPLFMSVPTNSFSFTHVTVRIISVLLCLVKYLLLARTLQPANRCSTVSFCLYTLPPVTNHSSCCLWGSCLSNLF